MLLSYSHRTTNLMPVGNAPVLFATLFPVPTTVPDVVCAQLIFSEGIKRREVGRRGEKEEGKKEGSRQGERQKRRNRGSNGANWEDI